MNDRSVERRLTPSCALSLAFMVLALLSACAPGDEPSAAIEPLPVRPGPRIETTYSVPHVQVFVDLVPEIDDDLRRQIFSLPNVERRDSITSIKGAEGLWLDADAGDTTAVLREREFAHIHPDGSLHLVLPIDRALEAIETKWAEFHPWVGREDMWDGMVMVYTPQTEAEADVVLQLVVDSYNFVTDRSATAADLE